METANPPWIHIELVPMWAQIKNLRHFVREFCTAMGVRPEAADQVAMTTSELLENATKYASDLWVRFDLRLSARYAEVSVANLAKAEQRRVLRTFLAEVAEGEPLDAYVRCLERESSSGVSQSGLARIRYEACGDLSLSENGDEVCVTARLPL
jgi:hypothetical protein